MKKITFFIKRRKYLIGSMILILLIIGYLVMASQKKAPINFYTVVRGEVNSEISITGKVKPSQNLDLAFEKGGRISKIYVTVGDKVQEGQKLIGLESSDLNAQLLQAQASAKSAQAKLDQLKRGTRPEDLKITQSALDKAKQDLANDYDGVIDILNDGYTKADDAVRVQTSQLFTNAEQTNPQLVFPISDSQLKIDLENSRHQMTTDLTLWKAELNQLNTSSDNSVLEKDLSDAESYLNDVSFFLNKTNDALTNALSLSQSLITTYKTQITAGKTEINTALSNVNNKNQAILSQKIVVQQNQNQLDLQLAGSDPEEIAAQQANVDQANANSAYYVAQIAKNNLTAPFEGVITKVVYNPGDIVAANVPVISLIGSGAYEIEADIGESDISGVKIGDLSKVTLDAYGPSVIFQAKVVQIDLSATVIDGVSTYKTTLQFSSEDSRILAGLTANLDIQSDKKENVLYIPTRNISTNNDGNKFVQVLTDVAKGTVNQVQIQTGLRGSDGRTEIVSGLNEGDKVVTD